MFFLVLILLMFAFLGGVYLGNKVFPYDFPETKFEPVYAENIVYITYRWREYKCGLGEHRNLSYVIRLDGEHTDHLTECDVINAWRKHLRYQDKEESLKRVV